MTIGVNTEGTIRLDGECSIDDAEELLRLIAADRGAMVDWRDCSGAHAAIVQILLAAAPRMHGPPADDFLRNHIEPLLNAGDRAQQSTA